MKQLTALFLLIIISVSAAAQLGGLLKKAKEKVTEKNPAATGQQGETGIALRQVENAGSEAKFVQYDQRYGYSGGTSGTSVADFKYRNQKFNPYDAIRKLDEKGVFHFAKDYSELASITAPADNGLKISFSTEPSGGDGVKTNAGFSSGNGRLYAKITATSGTIKDALKITDKDDGIKMGFTLYNDAEEKITTKEHLSHFELKAGDADVKSLIIDILPDLKLYKEGKTGSLYIPTFAYMHDQYTFPGNGNYKIGFFIKNEKTDDWGKSIYGEDILFYEFFDYSFSAKDAANITKEREAINDNLNNAKKYALKALPEQWTAKSHPLVMGFTQAKLTDMYEKSFSGTFDAHTTVKFHASQSNGGWTVMNNEYGIPLYRYSNQWYTIFIRYATGKSCYYQGFGLRQQYNGGGTYGAAFIDKGDFYMTDCSKMK